MTARHASTSKNHLKWFLMVPAIVLFFLLMFGWIETEQIREDEMFRAKLGFNWEYFAAGFFANLVGIYLAVKTWFATQKQGTPNRYVVRFLTLSSILILLFPFAYVPLWIRYWIGVAGPSDYFYLFGFEHAVFLVVLYSYIKLAKTQNRKPSENP